LDEIVYFDFMTKFEDCPFWLQVLVGMPHALLSENLLVILNR